LTLGGYATYQYSAGEIDAEQYGDRMIGMGLSLLGGVGTLRAAGLGSVTVGQATQVAVRTAQTTARAAGRALSQIELNPAALTQFNSGIPLNLLRWKQTGNPLAKIAEGFGTAAERSAPVRGLGSLSRAGQYGIQSYSSLTKALKGTGLQAHHLLEQRFAGALGANARSMLSVAVTKAEHQAFTNAWRKLIPYGDDTRKATQEQILKAAREIYKDYPDILKALGL
jgi:hypothetical protein